VEAFHQGLPEGMLQVEVLGASSLLVLVRLDLLGVRLLERKQGSGLGPLLTLYPLHGPFQVQHLLHR